jgi:Uma2 family endonuclease
MPEKPIIDIRQLDISGTYTYADYLTWRFQEKVELILGKVFKMSPAPTSQHQHIAVVLSSSMYHATRGNRCRVFSAPFDVILPVTPGVSNTVVQPDVTVVCDVSKITEQGCNGTPDLVVEIVSKSSVTKDLHEKFNVYEQARVREYWVVHPMDRTLVVFVLDEKGRYQPSKPLTKGDIVTSHVLPGLAVDLNELFVDVVEEQGEEYGVGMKRI